MAIQVSAWNDSAEPDIYWFGLAVDGVSVVFLPTSVVIIERQVGPNSWSSDLQLTIAEFPKWPGTYLIRTTVPASVANGQERIIRLTVDGVVYGPWSFRFGA